VIPTADRRYCNRRANLVGLADFANDFGQLRLGKQKLCQVNRRSEK